MFEMLDHNGPGHFGSSFALGFSEPNFVKKPTHPHQGRGSWRPNPRMRSQTSSRRTWPSCTSHWRPSWLGRRSPGQPRQLWAHRDTSRWKTWRIAGTPQRRRGRMAGTWDSGMGRTGSMSRPRPSRRCASFRQSGWQPAWSGGGNQGDHPAGQAGPTKAPLKVLCDRRQLEDAYVAIHGTPKPRLMAFSRSSGV